MKGSPCCAGLMRSCLHTYRTKTNLTQHIIQPWGGHQASMGRGVINQLWGGVAISQVWGGHQPSMGRGVINQLWGGHQPSMGGSSAKCGGAIRQVWGGHQPSMGRGVFNQVWVGGSSTNYGGWYHHVAMGDRGYLFSHQYVQELKIQRITLATHTSCLL